MPMPPLRDWTLNTCLKTWADIAQDSRHGGFFPRLGPDLRPVTEDPKPCLTIMRLLFTYAHATTLGAGPWARAAADSCYDFAVRHLWDETTGGWRMRVGCDGDPQGPGADPAKDTYDQGFVLLAMAWYHKVTGRAEPLDWMRRTMAFLDAEVRDPVHGGYHERLWKEGEPYPLPRRQNPHMHLLEGLLAACELTGERGWLERAAAIVDLMNRKFRDPANGTLREFMGRDWSDFPPPQGRVREPGHHFEWTWLLLHYRRLSGDDAVLPIADSLYGFAVRHGVENDPALPLAAYDEVAADGSVLTPSKILWPQTEAIKAFLARWEFLGDEDARMRAQRHLDAMFRHYIDTTSGAWCNRITRDGAPLETEVPTRILYHLYMALAEAIRVLPERA